MLSFCPWANTSAILEHTENQHKIHQEGLQSATCHCSVPFWKPESTWTVQHLAWIFVSRTNVFFRGEPKAKHDTKGSFSCRSAAGCTRDCNADRLPQITCSPNPTRNAFKEHLLEWASAKHGLSCIILGPINHSLVSSNGIRMWIEKHCWHRKTLRKWKGAFPALAFFQGHRMRKARYVVARPMDALGPIACII